MVYWKASHSSSKLHWTPFFSSIEVKRLKSPVPICTLENSSHGLVSIWGMLFNPGSTRIIGPWLYLKDNVSCWILRKYEYILTLKLLSIKYWTRESLNHSSTTQDVPLENPHNNEYEKPSNYLDYNRQIAENGFYIITYCFQHLGC